VKFYKLLRYAKRSVIGGDILFIPALDFLFIMGKIEYHPKNDSLEYIGL
jgi:hypothetical protein